jgi:hypothetical protein
VRRRPTRYGPRTSRAGKSRSVLRVGRTATNCVFVATPGFFPHPCIQRDAARRKVLAAQLGDGSDGAALLDAILADLDEGSAPGRKLLASKSASSKKGGGNRKGAPQQRAASGSTKKAGSSGGGSRGLSRAAAAAAEREALRAARPVDPFTPPLSVRGGSVAEEAAPGADASNPVQRSGEPLPDEAVDDSAWIASNKVELSNIWYFASRVTPWFEARSLNSSGMLPFALPPPAYVYLQVCNWGAR